MLWVIWLCACVRPMNHSSELGTIIKATRAAGGGEGNLSFIGPWEVVCVCLGKSLCSPEAMQFLLLKRRRYNSALGDIVHCSKPRLLLHCSWKRLLYMHSEKASSLPYWNLPEEASKLDSVASPYAVKGSKMGIMNCFDVVAKHSREALPGPCLLCRKEGILPP